MGAPLSELLKLKEQLGYYGAGGGKPSWPQDLGTALSSVGTGINAVTQGIGAGQEIYKKKLENQKLGQEVSPISVFGDVSKNNPNLSPNLSLEQNYKLAQLKSLFGGTDIYTNPLDSSKPPIIIPTGSPAPFGYTLQGRVPTKIGAPLATTVASAQQKLADENRPVQALSGEAAIKAGQVPKSAKIVSSIQQGISPYADVRATQSIMTDLPSRSAPSTQAGAASTVQFSARQGKQLIAEPGSPQRLALSAVDLARTIQRNAPTVDTLTNSGFAENLVTKLNLLKQKITTDPSSSDVPKLRKEIFDIFTDLENSSKPIIKRQLDTTESLWRDRLPQDWKKIRTSELGEDLPPINFNEGASGAKTPNVGDVEGNYRFRGGDPTKPENWSPF